MNPQAQIDQLSHRIAVLETLLKNSASFDDSIRDKVFFDIDNKTTTTTSISIPSGGGSATVPKSPDTYIRARFRGTVYNVPVYKLT